MNVVLVFPTWKCGLNCPYCRYDQQEDNKSIKYLGSGYLYKVDKELSPEEWIDLLKSEPALYDFSGGEPLKYNGIEKVLNSLPKWSITSNTLLYNNNIDLSRCAWWTASFHPHISEQAIDKFILNVNTIKSYNVGVGITLVAKPETLNSVLMWCNRFANMGFRVNIHPYYDDKDFNWYSYPKEMGALLSSPYLKYDKMLFKFSGLDKSGTCNGGKSYFVIGPDGEIFRCLTDMLFGRESIGNKDWIYGRLPKIRNTECNEKCFFPCDWKLGGRVNIK